MTFSVLVYPLAPPSVGPNQEAIPAVPVLIAGRLTQQWEVIDKPINPAVRVPYETLHSLLLTSPAYAGFVTRASAPGALESMPIAYAALSDALATARFGRPNVPAVQASLGAVISVGSFSAPELASIQALLVASGLDSIFTVA